MSMNDKSLYILGQLLFTGFSFLFNMAAARALGPQSMGSWQTILLISSYAPALCVGIVNGLGRELPVSLGQERPEIAREIVATCFRVVMGIALCLLFLIPFVARLPGVESLFLATIVFGLSAARIVHVFSAMLLRSLQQFSRLGLHQALSALILAVAIGVLQWNPTLLVVAVGMTGSFVLASVTAAPLVSLSGASLSRASALIRSGLPIYAAGLLFMLLGSTDRWLILYFLGTESLGLYTPAILAFAIITVSPMLVSNIKYPHLGYLYGKHKSASKLLPEIRRIVLLNLGFSGAVAIIGFLTMYYVVIPFVLPEYKDGLKSMAIIFIGGLVLPIGQSFGDLFNAIGRQRIYLRSMGAGLIVNIVSGGFLLGLADWGLEGVAVGTLAGMTVFSILQVSAYCIVLREAESG